MKYRFNHWFKPEDLQELVDRLIRNGHSEDAKCLCAKHANPNGQLARLDPKDAYQLSLKARMPIKTDRLPGDLKTVSTMVKAGKNSSLQDAFEAFMRKKQPEVDLTKDSGGSYLFWEASERFELFVAGTFC